MSNDSGTNGMNKNSIIDFPDSKSVETQASEWLAMLDAEEPSEEIIQGFKEWVNADDKHRQSFEGLIEFWDDLNILTQVVLPREEMLQHQTTPVRPHSFWSGNKFAVSSVALLVMVICTLWVAPNFQEQPPLIYTTKVGEQKTIELPDHTTVFLNTNTRIQVDYDDQKRAIKLLRGEAHFDVLHNPQKPFEVFAGKRLVRAIGTAFTVHLREIDVEVIVTEGIVEIDNAEPITLNVHVSNQQGLSDDAGESEEDLKQTSFESSVQVKAGNIARYDRQTLDQIKMVVAQQIEDELSWRQGMLIFKGEPLEKVVEEISRYTSLKIIIPERKARELKIGGFFKVGDTESLFEALQEGFDVHVNRVSDNMVYLISNENR